MANTPNIAIDLPQIDSSLSGVNSSYTKLGDALKALTSLSDFSEEKLSVIKSNTPKVLKGVDVESALNGVKSAVKSQQSSLRSSTRGIESLKASALKPSETSPDVSMGAKPGKLEESVGSLEIMIEKNSKDVERTLEGVVKNKQGHEDVIGKMTEKVREEARGARSAIRSVINKIPGNVGGGFVAALVGVMAEGYKQRKRKDAEAAETINIFATGVDNIYDSANMKSARSFAAWGEHAQWQWGVGRKEMQNVIKVAMDNGMRIADLERKFSDELGDVGKNVVTLSLGIAKHFNYSNADSIETITSLMRDYGMEQDDAAHAIIRMNDAGVRAGIGARQFMMATMSASDPLSNMGVNALEVGQMIETVIGHLQSKGLKSQYAGQQAIEVVSDLMSAIEGLDHEFKIALARRMGIGKEGDSAISILNDFRDGLKRAGGPDKEFVHSLVSNMYSMLREGISGGRSQFIYGARKILSVNNMTATIFHDVGKKFAAGGRLSDLEEDEQKGLMDAFKTESQRVSDLQKTKRSLLELMSHVGSTIMALLVNIVSIMTVGLQSLYAMATSPNDQRDLIVQNTYNAVNKYTQGMSVQWDKLQNGLVKAVSIMGNEFKGTFQVVSSILKDDLGVAAVDDGSEKPKGIREASSGDWGSRYRRAKKMSVREYQNEIKEFFRSTISRAKRDGDLSTLPRKMMDMMRDARDAELAYRYSMAGGYGSAGYEKISGDSERGGAHEAVDIESSLGAMDAPPLAKKALVEARQAALDEVMAEEGITMAERVKLFRYDLTSKDVPRNAWGFRTSDAGHSGSSMPGMAVELEIPEADDFTPTYGEAIALEAIGGTEEVIQAINRSRKKSMMKLIF